MFYKREESKLKKKMKMENLKITKVSFLSDHEVFAKNIAKSFAVACTVVVFFLLPVVGVSGLD